MVGVITMNLFVYDSLMFPKVWETVLAGEYLSDPTAVSGYVRKRVNDDSYPAVIPGDDEAVLHGRVYFHINQADLARLDEFKGEYFHREDTRALLANGHEVSAEIYVMKRDYRHLLSHEDWDPSRFVREEMGHFIAGHK